MAENAPDNTATDEEKTFDHNFWIGRIYMKDASFEAPNAAEIFIAETDWDPKIQVGVHTVSKKISSEQFETSLKITVTAKHQDNTTYIAEVVQSGLFTAKGFKDNELSALKYSYCANLLYPYASQAIADLIIKGGFPAYTVEPIDFEALYLQKKRAKAAAKAKAKAKEV